MLKIGQYNTLTITRFTDHGAYLDAGKELGDILLPKQYVKPEMRPGTEVEVIVYLDQQDRLVATTEQALAVVGDFAHLRVAWVNEYGAFLDWGLMKDLFVPFREQKLRMVKDHSYTVHIHVDPETARIVASAKVERYIEPAKFTDYHKGEEVDMLIWQKTDLGFKVIVNNKHQGQIYDNQIYENLRSGMRVRGTVVNVRPDGKLDLSVQKIGKGRGSAGAAMPSSFVISILIAILRYFPYNSLIFRLLVPASFLRRACCAELRLRHSRVRRRPKARQPR